MAFAHSQTGNACVPGVLTRQKSQPLRSYAFRWLMGLCLLATCLGASWFTVQMALFPQSHRFMANWHDARWIQAPDTVSPVAYFRYAVNFPALPDSAYMTVAANQVFRLYVNGTFIGSNTKDFVTGDAPQAYMFDVNSALQKGANVIGIRVVHADNGTPQLRATFAPVWGHMTHYYRTGLDGWLTTGRADLAHLRQSPTLYEWSKASFQATGWQAGKPAVHAPSSELSSQLSVNPQVYERPLPQYWLSAGSGEESYFVRRFTMPQNFDSALLRIIATGEAAIFINDHQYMRWNGQANVPMENVVNYLNATYHNGEAAPYRNGLSLGIYDITPYVHEGWNTIAIHVLTPGVTTAKVGLEAQKSSLSADMVVDTSGHSSDPLNSMLGWHASLHAVDGWTQASRATNLWPVPAPIGRPGASHSFYLPDSDTNRNVQLIPTGVLVEIIVSCVCMILMYWLGLGLLALRRFYRSSYAALEAASLAFLPALALEALLTVCARQTQLPQPFPYTLFWGLLLVAMVFVASGVLWWHARLVAYRSIEVLNDGYTRERAIRFSTFLPGYRALTDRLAIVGNSIWLRWLPRRFRTWLKFHWPIVPVIAMVIPMVGYNLGYEPYWQDELSSFYAACNIMQHGIPAFPSGFIYPKAELFSYILALLMSVIGTGHMLFPRLISLVEFLVSLPIFYIIGYKLFNRRVAWLAMAMLAFSPYTMIWSRQTRMYEQAQFMVVIVFYLFFWALKNQERVKPIFLAIVSLLICYFSHEESFITMPGILICMLLGSRAGRYGFPTVLRRKHWWIACLVAIMVIGAQLSVVYLSHPPTFGTDQSTRPQIQLTTDNIPYYYHLLFMPLPTKDGPSPWASVQPFLLVNSLFAVLGCILAFCRKGKPARYTALFLIISTCTLAFLFTMQADRYYYPLLPLYYLIGAYGFWQVLHALWLFARPYVQFAYTRSWRRSGETGLGRGLDLRPGWTVRVAVRGTVALFCAAILLMPMLPVSNYNLFASRLLGVSYHHHYADYDNAGRYIRQHMLPGDEVVTIAPAVIVLHYVGHVDHFFSIDRALFLFEEDGKLVETTSGSHPILNQHEFLTLMAQHRRIWLITDNGGYQGGATKNGRFTFPPPDFRLVYEGYGSAVYFRNVDG